MENAMIYPELGQTTKATIEYSVSYNGGFYVSTSLALSGRGIKQNGDGSSHARGLKTYHVTELALKNLKAKHSACYIASL
jgi:hypothetical protein